MHSHKCPSAVCISHKCPSAVCISLLLVSCVLSVSISMSGCCPSISTCGLCVSVVLLCVTVSICLAYVCCLFLMTPAYALHIWFLLTGTSQQSWSRGASLEHFAGLSIGLCCVAHTVWCPLGTQQVCGCERWPEHDSLAHRACCVPAVHWQLDLWNSHNQPVSDSPKHRWNHHNQQQPEAYWWPDLWNNHNESISNSLKLRWNHHNQQTAWSILMTWPVEQPQSINKWQPEAQVKASQSATA